MDSPFDDYFLQIGLGECDYGSSQGLKKFRDDFMSSDDTVKWEFFAEIDDKSLDM